MTRFTRHALFVLPEPGPFAAAAAAWLGWEIGTGMARGQPCLPDLPRPLGDLTGAARRYGFHATIKAPFRLAPDVGTDDLALGIETVSKSLARLSLDLEIRSIGSFVAFVPVGDTDGIGRFAATVTAGLDRFRAPLSDDDIERRRPDTLTARQRENLLEWGYPYVMDDFRFHMTLTGTVDAAETGPVICAAASHFDAVLPRPFQVTSLCHCAERQDGCFELVHRFPLSG